jgi:nucleotide-binding universal stress UspA family protein
MRILVATDGSDCSEAALHEVSNRPWPRDSQVLVFSVAAPPPYIEDPLIPASPAYADLVEEERLRAEAAASQAASSLARRAPELTVTSKGGSGSPNVAILDEARRWEADLIVLGSHGRGLAQRLLLGSVSNAVALHAPCSVEIVRRRAAAPASAAKSPRGSKP